MVLESAYPSVKPGQGPEFEAAFGRASSPIASTPGYRRHRLHRALEDPSLYLLLVERDTLEAHTAGSRQSPRYQDWEKLLHRFYEPFPTVWHPTPVYP
ncbi:Antibiotic biosynthesis monooxygenase [Calidithermus terrae]|uniref:Antibiotic biosynthesis monooxygenase n=1 Tax=Calidithermus terrae TaxID=1408545 RepID=A0A399F5M8_9DEIN|nr:antibiotic biosynthesis monooxygenase [Calidithermus terrae]RIH90956.1 Antibiotic biosynthesis monooxygenase [Calidithermus terrae]